MAWWRFGRAERDGAAATDPVARPEAPSVTAPAPTPVTQRSSEPQGWRIVDPVATTADRPMPLTFDATVQRALASHTTPERLLATGRPMGHEVRRDGPIGTVGSLMRSVGSDAAH